MIKTTIIDNMDIINVVILDIEKDNAIEEYNYTLQKLNDSYLLELEFTIKEQLEQELKNKYAPYLSKIGLERLIYLIIQYDKQLYISTVNDVISSLIKGYDNTNTAEYYYNILKQIDLTYYTFLTLKFRPRRVTNVI